MLYGNLPPVSSKIRQARLRFAGYWWRAKLELASQTVLWNPSHDKANVGRPSLTYIDQLCSDTGCAPEELPTAMDDRDEWRKRVEASRARTTRWWWWQYILLCDTTEIMGHFSQCLWIWNLKTRENVCFFRLGNLADFTNWCQMGYHGNTPTY